MTPPIFPGSTKTQKSLRKKLLVRSAFALILTQKPWRQHGGGGVRVTRQSQGVWVSLRPSLCFSMENAQNSLFVTSQSKCLKFLYSFLSFWIRNISSFILPPNLTTFKWQKRVENFALKSAKFAPENAKKPLILTNLVSFCYF